MPPNTLVLYFRNLASFRCSITTPVRFIRVNADATGGTAEVAYGMKAEFTPKVGSAPPSVESLVTMLLSKRGPSAPWLIERMTQTPKPKE